MSGWPHPLCQDNHKLHEVGKIMSQAIHEGSGCNSKFEQLTGSQKSQAWSSFSSFETRAMQWLSKTKVSTICLKNLVEVLIVLTPVTQIYMRCTLINVMAKVTLRFVKSYFFILESFPCSLEA